MAINNVNSNCNGCGICIEICPNDVFRMQEQVAVVRYPQDCQVCFQCEEECPNNAIELTIYVNGYPVPY